MSYRFIISELHYNNDMVVVVENEATDEEISSGWIEKQKWLVGSYTVTEWRSDRNHLEVECIVENGADPIPAQILALEVYRTLRDKQ